MNGYRSIRFPRKRIFIIDELALVLAFFSAILIRYRSDARYWAGFFDGLYVSVLVVAVLMQAIIFLVYDSRRPSLFVQDRVQGLFYIIKGRMILLIFIILYLYMTQKGVDSSRFVIGATIMLNVFYDYILRNIIKSQYFSMVGELKEKILELSFPFPSDEEIRKKISEGDISKVLIHPGDAAEEEIERVISVADVMGIHPFVGLKSLGYDVRSGIVRDISDYASIPVSVRKERFDIFGVHYAVARVEEAVLHVKRHVKELKGEYICFSNVHTLVMARENPDYARDLNESAFAFPDGAPIAQLQQKSGMELAERVAGPDFMEHMFKASTDGSITHYFYGASQNTLDELNKKLLEKYPGIVIKGMYSPPFRELTPEEDQRDVDMINASGADILWVGLGAPKQEKWMNAHKGRINAVMMGVGAGFDFHAGTINRAPIWIQ